MSTVIFMDDQWPDTLDETLACERFFLSSADSPLNLLLPSIGKKTHMSVPTNGSLCPGGRLSGFLGHP